MVKPTCTITDAGGGASLLGVELTQQTFATSHIQEMSLITNGSDQMKPAHVPDSTAGRKEFST